MDYEIEVTDFEKDLIEKAAAHYGGDIGALATMIISSDQVELPAGSGQGSA